ncbi:DNA replication/repair protein RecF [bacterium]|nr:DNA replication/repair protein RecF [bacterium]
MLRRIWVKNFRNLSEQLLELDPKFTVIRGENNQGKTNLLEAIYFGISGGTIMDESLHDLPSFSSADSAVVGVDFESSTSHRLYREVSRRGAKFPVLDGESVRQARDQVPHGAAYWSADLIRSIQDSADERRKMVDRIVVKKDRKLEFLYKSYQRVLSQRNACLRTGNRSLIRFYNDRFIELSMAVTSARERMVVELCDRVGPYISDILGDRLLTVSGVIQMKGIDRLQDVDSFKHALEHRLEKDFALGFTSVGAHRDDIEFFIDGQSVVRYLSRGVNRIFALLLNLSGLESMVSKVPMILLIDDAFCEVSSRLKDRVLPFLLGRFQIVYVSTNTDEFRDFSGKRFIMELGVCTDG